MLPRHCTGTDELKPQLQLLLSHFGICYDTDNLKNSADEMQLFSLVIRSLKKTQTTELGGKVGLETEECK